MLLLIATLNLQLISLVFFKLLKSAVKLNVPQTKELWLDQDQHRELTNPLELGIFSNESCQSLSVDFSYDKEANNINNRRNKT